MANSNGKGAAKVDPRIDKRRVTMRSARIAGVDKDGRTVYAELEKVDYVRPDFLDAYVAAARTEWDTVEVSDEPDAGPGGYHGATHVPDTLSHPLAGATFAATTED